METQKQAFYKFDNRFKMEPYIQQQLDAYIASEKEKPENQQHPTAKMLNCTSVRIHVAKFLSYFESLRRTDELEKVSFQYDDEIVTEQFAVMSFSEIVAKVGISKSQAERVRKVIDQIGLAKVGKGKNTRKRMYTPDFSHPLIASLRLNDIAMDKEKPYKQPERGFRNNSIEEAEVYNFAKALYNYFGYGDISGKEQLEKLEGLAGFIWKKFGVAKIKKLNSEFHCFLQLIKDFGYVVAYAANPYEFLAATKKYDISQLLGKKQQFKYNNAARKVDVMLETSTHYNKDFAIIFSEENRKLYNSGNISDELRKFIVKKVQKGDFGDMTAPAFQGKLERYLYTCIRKKNSKDNL